MIAIVLLGVGSAVGYVGSRFQRTGPWNLGERVAAMAGGGIADVDDALEELESRIPADDAARLSSQIPQLLQAEIDRSGARFAHVFEAIPRLAPLLRPREHEAIRTVLRARFSPAESDLAFHYLVALSSNAPASIHALETMSTADKPMRYARFALGRVEFKRHHFADAFRWFFGEGTQPEAESARWMAIRALIAGKDYTALARLERDPAYAPLFTPYVSLQVAVGNRDWREIVRRSPLVQLELFEPRILGMTLLVAAAWIFFFLHLAEAPRPWSAMTVLCLGGVGLGVLSTVPTVYAVIWQDDILGLKAGPEIVQTVLYFVGGVGLREEICKLLLFLPLLPFLRRRDDEYEALMVASFVGLGFAIEENGGYFMMSQLAAAPGRFLTANFLHAALTGLNGLALFRACRRGPSGVNDFLAMFPFTVLAHGLYDAGLSLPTVDDTGTASMVIFVGCSWFYFSRVHDLRHTVQSTVSLTGAYVLAVSIVAAAMLAFQMMNLGPDAGLQIAAGEIIGSAILVYMFIREFREPLTP